MSTAGWYADPDGTPGRYRYWDGRSWSEVTTDDPRTAEPENGARRAAGPAAAGSKSKPSRAVDPDYSPARAAAPQHRRGVAGLIIAGVVLLVIIVGVGGVIAWRGIGPSLAGPPEASVSAWDDSSPTNAPSPSPSPSNPSTPASGTPSDPPAGQARCPDGDPAHGPEDPDDGRVHGGRISFAGVEDYAAPEPRQRLSWFYDTASQFQATEPGWGSSFTVGEVRRATTFATPREAVTRTVQCMITGEGFEGFAGRKDLRNAAITVDGRPAWMIMTEVRVDRDDIDVDGDRVVVIIVDDGRKDRLSGFVGLVPLGDTSRIALLDRVIKGLRVD